MQRSEKMYVSTVWSNGFKHKYTITKSKYSLENEIKHLSKLTNIVKYTISQNDGTILAEKK